jgi:hypothetical protein
MNAAEWAIEVILIESKIPYTAKNRFYCRKVFCKREAIMYIIPQETCFQVDIQKGVKQ